MAWLLLISVLVVAGVVIWQQNERIKKLTETVDMQKDNDEDGYILSIIRNNDDIVYYKDMYRENGVDMTMHTIGAKGWSFQQCQELGVVTVSVREHDFDAGRSMLDMLVSLYGRDLADTYSKLNK